MKKRLASLLAALLLCLTLFPAQALAAEEPDPVTPPAVTEPENPETPEDPDEPEEPETPAPQLRTTGQPPEVPDPDPDDGNH